MTAQPPSRRLAFGWAVGATLLGIVSLTLAGAPAHYPVINAGALVIGVMLAASLIIVCRSLRLGAATFAIGIAAVLLATALAGVRVDGAARWLDVGPVLIQPALMLVPAAAIAFARSPSWGAASGLSISALALALQPDRGTAGAFAVALAVIASWERRPETVIAFVAATMAFAATLGRADTLPPMPLVEHLLRMDPASVAGAAAWIGALAMLAPGVTFIRHAPSAAFVAVWLALLAASTIGNYPTPVIGYGASGVIGYVLSLAALTAPRGRVRD